MLLTHDENIIAEHQENVGIVECHDESCPGGVLKDGLGHANKVKGGRIVVQVRVGNGWIAIVGSTIIRRRQQRTFNGNDAGNGFGSVAGIDESIIMIVVVVWLCTATSIECIVGCLGCWVGSDLGSRTQ